MSEEKKIGISNSDRAHVLVQAMPSNTAEML